MRTSSLGLDSWILPSNVSGHLQRNQTPWLWKYSLAPVFFNLIEGHDILDDPAKNGFDYPSLDSSQETQIPWTSALGICIWGLAFVTYSPMVISVLGMGRPHGKGGAILEGCTFWDSSVHLSCQPSIKALWFEPFLCCLKRAFRYISTWIMGWWRHMIFICLSLLLQPWCKWETLLESTDDTAFIFSSLGVIRSSQLGK